MSGKRRRLTAERTLQIVLQHLSGKEPLCTQAEQVRLQPGVIHNCVNQVLTQVEQVFERTPESGQSRRTKEQRQIEQLKTKLVNKNKVIAELMEANVLATREPGDL